MGKKKQILDPLWITEKDYIDSEYYGYILMGAKKRYIEALDKSNFDNFYEIMFHFLNLNNLVIDGNLYDFKMNSAWKDPKIKQIKRDLQTFYGDSSETGETVKLAHSIFRNLLLEYLDVQVERFERFSNMFYVNPQLHKSDNIFVVMNRLEDPTYEIWKFNLDRRCHMGHRFEKLISIEMDNPKENELKEKIKALNDPVLNKMDSAKNVLFCAVQSDEVELDDIVPIVKNTLLMNKVMINAPVFDPNILANSYITLYTENILPFKLTPVHV